MKTKLVAGLRWWEFSSADGNLGAGESHQDRLQDDVKNRNEEEIEDGGEDHASDDGSTNGVTTVGSDGFFMVGVHIGHDCVVGDHVIMANNATLGGHTEMSDFVIMGGLSAAHQNTRIGRHAFVGGMAGVNHDVIPFGNVWGNHAHLEGLNLVCLKRRGFSREAINTLRAAYRMLFAEEGTFQERLEDTAAAYAASPEVMEIVEFIRADANRPLTTPQREI